ncbi:hypothetical protein HN51_053466 [Arachis hypogaea]
MAKLTIAKKLFLLLLVSGVLMTTLVIGDKRCEDVWYDERIYDNNPIAQYLFVSPIVLIGY